MPKPAIISFDANAEMEQWPDFPQSEIASGSRAQRGHAWLLQGPSGLGQFDLALALVRAWLCENPTPQGACGQCPSCHAIDVHTHTDLVVLMPETALLARGWPLPPTRRHPAPQPVRRRPRCPPDRS